LRVLLLDDADKPTRIEYFLGPQYFQQQSSRIRIVRFSRQMGGEGEVTDLRRISKWLADSGSWSTFGKWTGRFGRVTSRKYWSRSSEVSAMLNEVREPISNVYELIQSKGLEKDWSAYFNPNPVWYGILAEGSRHVLHAEPPTSAWTTVLTYVGEEQVRSSYSCRGEIGPGQNSDDDPLWVGSRVIERGLSASAFNFDPQSGFLIRPEGVCESPERVFVPD
jgi:hypothetical protein